MITFVQTLQQSQTFPIMDNSVGKMVNINQASQKWIDYSRHLICLGQYMEKYISPKTKFGLFR